MELKRAMRKLWKIALVIILLAGTLPVGTHAQDDENLPHLGSYCRSLGYGGATTVDNTSYGWRCFEWVGNKQVMHEMSVDEACVFTYGQGARAIDLDFYDETSWRCILPGESLPQSATPTSQPEGTAPTPQAGRPAECAGAKPDNISVGLRVWVPRDNSGASTLWSNPQGERLFQVEEGEAGLVLDGPTCTPGKYGGILTWWKVLLDTGETGWMTTGYGLSNHWLALENNIPTFPPDYSYLPLKTVNGVQYRQGEGSCNNAPDPRLKPGDLVTTDGQSSRWSAPSHPRIDYLQQGTRIEILAVPICQNGYYWYPFKTASSQNIRFGWITEGEGDEYWLTPQ